MKLRRWTAAALCSPRSSTGDAVDCLDDQRDCHLCQTRQIGETWTCFAFCQTSAKSTTASSHSLHRRSLPLPPHFLPRHGTFDLQPAGSLPMASPSPLTSFSHS
jgi:hypothetical protein